MINVYGPQETSAKSSLWNRITEFMHQHNRKFILFGDMNTVRDKNERSGSLFSRNEADHFNSFIDSLGLTDLPIGGRYYTWMNKAGTKLSKLDRFLIFDRFLIDRMWSDHTPILLYVMKLDFGPTPFMFYNSWLNKDSFDDLIKSTWSTLEVPNDGGILRSHEKLRCLKTAIKQWHSNTRNNDRTLKQWDIEGDENFKFFHGMINNKRRSQAITGILHDGLWISDPLLIKEDFLNYYKDKFQAHDFQVVLSPMIHSTSLTSLDHDSLETHISLDYIKTTVWDCGSNKAPCHDGFSFAFIKNYWDLIKTDIFEFVNSFVDSGSMPKCANSSFFTLIPKTSRPISIKYFRPISLIGIHYKIIAKVLANRLSKVIDNVISKEQSAFISSRQILDSPLISISWKDMYYVLLSLGFGSKWRSWIRVYLQSSRASILINGSPTSEFSIKRGSRQGDPLSLFLFILAMEGLHGAMSNAVNSGLIRGLKINIHKSNIYDIGVSNDEVSSMASRTRSVAGSFPFIYLGLPIGSNMNLTSSWNILVDRFQKRLSSWKAILLSIGGRVGCDTHIRFWKDIWIGDSSLHIRYNRLYRLEQDKDCFIIDRIVNGQWHWNWSRVDIGIRNMAYLRELLLEIS
ncbi:putative RNA-directed DNA polymerase, eukaryota, reverse transcriptase zinc-binding domain protein [Tanacetum coccineum]|uniref:RNA-directed DNA polymerase, eukaryota, reverse transcriptase zinc-binding domain protein n=1 Tax=Tanacetum coccineum TaxID=301880 RepID=A0ABQ5AQD0_9ASTR